MCTLEVLSKPVILVNLFLKFVFNRYELSYYSMNTSPVTVVTDILGVIRSRVAYEL